MLFKSKDCAKAIYSIILEIKQWLILKLTVEHMQPEEEASDKCDPLASAELLGEVLEVDERYPDSAYREDLI